MCRFSELTGCKFRREVTLDETYDCQLLLSKITRRLRDCGRSNSYVLIRHSSRDVVSVRPSLFF